jgi:hypothetical protein
MRREQIIEAVEKLNSALEETDLRRKVNNVLMKRDSRADSNSTAVQELLKSLHDFGVIASHFGQEEFHMIEYLGITPLLDAKFWPSLFSESARQSREVAEVYEGLKDALTFLPKFIKILNRESDQEKSQILNENEGERSQDVTTPKVLVQAGSIG